jgi:hypothetical protein
LTALVEAVVDGQMKSGEEDMGTQDDFFEALGPTSPAPHDSPGFFCNGPQIWRGVDVTGRQLGVRGRGRDIGSVGVEGHGGPGGNGVIGFSAAAVRTASNPAGVVGVGDGNQAAGVRGEALGPNAGVVGISNSSSGGVTLPGVYGESTDGTGVSAIGDTGVYAEGKNGLGLQAVSAFRAQINLVPSTTQTDPKQFPISEVGDLAVTITDPPDFPSLWFCVVGGKAGLSVWKKIA